MNKSSRFVLRAVINYLRQRSSVYGKIGKESKRDQFNRWADCVKELLERTPKGCFGCAYKDAQNGRCVDCARVSNRTDNWRRKII